LDVKDLRVFEMVARYEGIKRAALGLNTVQSNVTARIRALEDELGVALFERRSNGMKLTPAGLRLLPYAYEARAAIENATRAATDDGVPRGRLLIGCRKTTTALHLTRLLSLYLADYPQVDVQIRTETSPLLIDLVLERRLEGALVCAPVERNDLVGEIILDEELVVLTPEKIESLDVVESDTRLIVLGQGNFYQTQLRAILARHGVAVSRTIELGTVEAVINCVSAGLGITLLPRAVLNLIAPEAVRVHQITDEACRAQTVFIRRRDAFVSAAMSAFIDCARTLWQ
jgi:DNA-binding transcriptional LysR family regulator